jgi:hypothetical protein
MKLLYRVVRPLKAKAATSEHDRKLLPGENFLYDAPQTAETVRIDIDGIFYFIDRAIIETHCRFLGVILVDTTLLKPKTIGA